MEVVPIKKSDEFLRLEKDLAGSEELVAKLDAAAKEALSSGECKTDGDVLSRAASALGYDIPVAELERMMARNQQLDLDEMEKIAGGGDEECEFYWRQRWEDEYGHGVRCMTLWHCLTVTCHTETTNTDVHCWSDYTCMQIYYCHQGNKWPT